MSSIGTMDPFTKRMLERAKARREKLDAQLSNAGHQVKPQRCPLRDANSSIEEASNVATTAIATTSAAATNTNESPTKYCKAQPRIFKSPEKCKKNIGDIPDKENNSHLVSGVKSKLERLGKLYSDDASNELSSPIHRTEEQFSEEVEDDYCSKPTTKRVGARLDRLAALASTINNWEDDLSHPQVMKKSENSKAEKIHAKINEQIKNANDPMPSTSGYSRWKSNGNNGTNNSTRQLKLDNQESQGFTRTISNSRLVYDFKACSQGSKSAGSASTKPVCIDGVKKTTDKSKKAEESPKSSWLPRTPEKSNTSNGGNRSANRFGGYSGSPKNIISSPGSVLSKASLFESKSLVTKAKDPAEMSLSERMALFERNKGEALIPKAPLTLSVPTNKLHESSKSLNNSDQSIKSVSNSRAMFEQGLAKQELENDILRDTQTERKKELEMLRSRFNKNKGVAQVAAESCIRARNNSENNSGSLKNSPVCPVKPTPATDHIPPPPPLPNSSSNQSNHQERSSSKRQVLVTSPQNPIQPSFNDIKRIRVSPPKSGNLYPDLTTLETETTETDTDSEFTVATTEPETVTLEEPSDQCNSDVDTDDYNLDDGNTSFESSILKIVKRQAMTNKRQIESDVSSSTSDISVLDEMDEYLDECLAKQDANGPTPPKINRSTVSPSMASSSFKYSTTGNYQSPIKIVHRSPVVREPYIIDGDNHVPLMHSVSFYRRQQLTPKTPVKQVGRTAATAVAASSTSSSSSGFDDESGGKYNQYQQQQQQQQHEAVLVSDKIKRLMDEVCKQQTIIGQASQALNLCTATVEFSGSREQVEGERLLLVATHRRQAALNEIQRLKIEGTLHPPVPGESQVQESGSLTVSALTLPLRKDYHADRDMCMHFMCLVRHLDTIIATPVIQAEPGDSCVRFPSTLKLDDLYSDFKITIEVYTLETRAEILPHEIKYHIHSAGHAGCGGAGGSKKSGVKTPKKLLKQERLIMPSIQSPAGPGAVRSPAFTLSGYVVFSLREVNRQQFTLNKLPKYTSLEGHLQMHVTCELSIDVEHRGFLTMFEDVSGFGAWHRRWCLLKGDTLSYWKYPDDERKKTPIASLELQGVVTKNVNLVSRDICARPNTFLIETVRQAQPGDAESLIVVKNGPITTIRHLLSADTKEERLEWCSKLNQTINLIRAWGGRST